MYVIIVCHTDKNGRSWSNILDDRARVRVSLQTKGDEWEEGVGLLTLD